MSSAIEITPELLAGFLDEAPEYLEMLDTGLLDFEAKAGTDVLALESPEDQEQMNTMFRAAHSLKGLAAVFGFDKIKELTHRMETLFDQVRMKKRDLTTDSFETLFNVFDRLKALVNELSDDSGAPVEIEDILAALDRLLDDQPTSPEVSTVATAAPGEKPSTQDHIDVLGDPELVALFLETTTEAVDELNQGLLRLEEHPADENLLNVVFRCAHNIKGASGAAGLAGMNRLTHDMETVFDRLRSGHLSLSDELMNAVFQAVDRLRLVIDALREGRVEDIPDDEMRAQFEQWTSSTETPAPRPDARNTASPERSEAGRSENTDSLAGETPGDAILTLRVTFAKGSEEAPIQAYLIHNKLNDLGNVLSSEPDIEALAGDTPLEEIVFTMETEDDPAAIERIVGGYEIASVTLSVGSHDGGAAGALPEPARREPTSAEEDRAGSAQPAASSSSLSESKAEAAPAKSAVRVPGAASRPRRGAAEQTVRKSGETLRVDLERLDHLMNLGGELVINRARFVQIHSELRSVLDGKNLGYLVDDITDHMAQLGRRIDAVREGQGSLRDLEDVVSRLLQLKDTFDPIRSLIHRVHDLRSSMFNFDEALHGLSRVSDGIQKGIMSTRMLSIGPLFNRFRRVVRDITKSNGKKIDLILHGENTELDKRMIDELGDPLTHMVRNSCDHGVEAPDVRAAAGKNPTGTLILEAYHRGNSICIAIKDDGAGVNLERVRSKILERELATPSQVEQMSDRDLVQYIFKPGFSTAETVTDVSGRGMGMDIVLNKLEKLNGTIEVDSTPGQGTVIVIKLPLTLAILTSMVARINRGVYAIPLEAVSEIITVRREDIQCIQRRQVVRVRDRVVPIAWFEDIFRTSLSGLQTLAHDSDEVTLMIIGFENEQIGLVVDELLGQEDVVIKSIAENYTNVRGIAGASIRGDGTVSLILDVAAMMEMASKSAAVAATPQPAGVPG